jgi:hypothetical protein
LFGILAHLAGISRLMNTIEDPKEARRAIRVVGATDAVMATEQIRCEPVDQQVFEHSAAILRGQLAAPDVDAAWSEGQAMTLEQAVASALEEGVDAPMEW